MTRRVAALVLAGLCLLAGGAPAARVARPAPVIAVPRRASALEALAAREVRRYLYLRTGRLASITSTDALPAGPAIVVARADRPLARALAAPKLGPQEYVLRTVSRAGRNAALVAGGDDAGTLYGAYRFAERLGVRFGLDGDVVPDARIPLAVPKLNERGRPLFALRGIQPFHDFPEGPDWWGLDDYRAIIAQLPKLGMNFLGLHTYPEPIAEPTVWIGPAGEVGDAGRVKAAYPSSYQNTLRGDWGYAAKNTGAFSFGASALFDRDAYGSEVMRDLCPKPSTPAAMADLFNRTGDMLRGAFDFAHLLGVKTCAGTETPLVVPQPVQARLKAAGKDPADPNVVRELYAAMFRRIMAAYPLDYYWLWTPEGWTWSGTTPEQVQTTARDLQAALDAAREVKAPFTVGTCGWVLGPPADRAAFDRLLPKDAPMSCINRQVGMEPVEPGFAAVKGRPKWAIPWLEDDPALTAPQLWAGRMRRDAFDALRYGCTGLMGIHWRTRAIGPNVMALARSGWDQSGWKRAAVTEGPEGGQVSAFPGVHFANAVDSTIYQTVRYNLTAYHFRVPSATYTVTLHLCEPAYDAPGKRVFGVKIQGAEVIKDLDIFQKVGKNVALDYTFPGVRVTGGRLDIDFLPVVEYPCVAAIEVVGGNGVARRVNCGGPAYRNYAADPEPAPRGLPIADFYRDWAAHEFGPEAAGPIATVFAKVDGNLPRPLEWTDGPGGLRPDGRSWAQAAPDYAFVAELEELAPRVRGAGNRARYGWWLDEFAYLRTVAHLRCEWGQFNRAMAAVQAEKDPAARTRVAREQALPLRRALVTRLGEVYRRLLGTVSTNGELGTVANWEQHILPGLIEAPGRELAAALGEPLPADAELPAAYSGPLRVAVPTARTSLLSGEPLNLRVLVLSSAPPRDAALYWRPLGSARYARVSLSHVARGVYSARLSPATTKGGDFEYHIKVTPARGSAVCWPPAAPALDQTVVYMPR